MTAILPGATLGVLGGGQLGRMFVHAAQSLGYAVAVLEADAASPAAQAAQHTVAAGYTDADGLARLAALSAAVTTEFENVPADALRTLAAMRPVAPGADAVAVCQDRAAEKAHFVRCGVPCAPYAVIETEAQLAAAWQAMGRAPCVLEQRLPLAHELSVIVARNAAGGCVHLPVQHNLHRDGILAVTQVPAPEVPLALQQQAITSAEAVAASLGYVGVLCVEFFVLADGRLVANEMAPRPHNSGHYSIDACDVSQFELQVRAMCGLPLVAPRLHSPSVMLNLLGDLWFGADGRERTPPWAEVLALPGVHLHLYGKADARRGRKMGHLTVTAADAGSAHTVAQQACVLLGLPPF